MYKRIIIGVSAVAIASLMLPLVANAVTQKEMEEARTIAAKAYLRYANDGSGYLDEINPTTMADLEAQLKTKEKENIVAFKLIPVPSDYKDWNKEKLLEYWAVTAFQNENLTEKGKGGRVRARSLINKMTISANSGSEPEAPAEKEAPKETETTQNGEQSEVAEGLQVDENAIIAQEDLEEQDFSTEKETDYTWVYIMILAILVAVVLALVVFASNVLKKNGSASSHSPRRSEGHDGETSEKLEEYEATLADKNVEIAMLTKRLETTTRQNDELKSKLEILTAELQTLKQAKTNNADEIKTERTIQSNPGTTKSQVRSIFLGRANSKGIFVRADRNLNVGNSVFILETSDGYSGSFKVADSPAAWSLALSNPEEYLETACVGYDLDNTQNASRIVTEASGTAVFEGGCWRVIRKARIRYE